MKLISLQCKNCGAQLQVDPERKQVFCTYCGAKLLLDDDNINITNRFVDEARLKEAEIRLRELEYEHERELRAETIRQEQDKSFRLALLIFACAVIVTYLVPFLNDVLIFVLIFGSIALASMRTGDKRSRTEGGTVGYSPKSRMKAVLICLFLGEFGIHYFYVGRIWMGILYLCTFGLMGVGWLIDIIRIACGTFRDRNGYYLR